MAKRADDEGKSWPIWEHVAVSAEVAAELKYERQARRAEEEAARPLSEIPEGLPDAPAVSSTLAAWNGPTLKLFSWEALEQDRATMETLGQDSDDRQRKSAIHERLLQRGEYRRLARLPADWRTQLDEIEALFPNFAAVVDYLRAMFAVAELGETSPHLDPLLFNGPSGVGKSLFAERLGDFFGSGYRRVNMENAQTNAQLAGSDEFWSNSKTGGCSTPWSRAITRTRCSSWMKSIRSVAGRSSTPSAPCTACSNRQRRRVFATCRCRASRSTRAGSIGC